MASVPPPSSYRVFANEGNGGITLALIEIKIGDFETNTVTLGKLFVNKFGEFLLIKIN